MEGNSHRSGGAQEQFIIEEHLSVTGKTRNRSWWRRKGSLKKALIVVLFIAAIIAIATSVLATNVIGRFFGNRYCTSQDCIRTAAELLDAMDSEVNPCHDFFEYACGSWNRKHAIPVNKSHYTRRSQLKDETRLKLKSLLEEPVTDDDILATQNAKTFYKSCLNISLINSRGYEPLLSLLDQLGGWPVLNDSWKKSTFDWIKLMARMQLLDFEPAFIRIQVDKDPKNTTVNIFQISAIKTREYTYNLEPATFGRRHTGKQVIFLFGSPNEKLQRFRPTLQMDQQPTLGLHRDLFLNIPSDEGIVRTYTRLATDLAILLGAKAIRASRDMREMVSLEIRLAKITLPDLHIQRNLEATYNRYTLAEMYTKVTPKIDWMKFVTLLFNNVSLPITEDEEVIVYQPDYMKHLAEVIATTSKRTIANYMMWQIVRGSINRMPQSYRHLFRDYIKAQFGRTLEEARWVDCVNDVVELFGMAVGRMFVERHFGKRTKTSVLEMTKNVRDAYNERLGKVSWMDTHTRKLARLKADVMLPHIGYPEYIMNDTALNMDYAGIKADPKRYFENVIDYNNINIRKHLRELREPADKSKWPVILSPVTVNAVYDPTSNSITVPAAMFQPPNYNENYPMSVNFGGIGMVIGHEMTHNVDDRGRQFDKDGNMRSWWPDDVIKRYKEKTQCIIKQYSNYWVREVDTYIDGRKTENENVADNGGLKQAFRAYRMWVEQQGHEEDLLTGIDLNHNQLFFLGYAQVNCGRIKHVFDHPHSPRRFRVNGAISNFEEFAKAYNCPIGSQMNPVRKCNVW